MRSRAAKIVFALLWLAIFVELLTDDSLREALLRFLTVHPYAAPVVLVAIQSALAALALPCSPLTVLAGLLWGVWFGLLYSTIATMCASMLTFALGRRVLRGWLLERLESGWGARVVALIERHGWKASAIAHANPLLPGSSLGYCFGASRIPAAAFAAGALAGNLPLQILMVKAGDVTRELAEGGVTTGIVIAVILVALAYGLYRFAAPLLLDSGEPPDGAS